MRRVLLIQVVGVLVSGAVLNSSASSHRFRARFVQKDADRTVEEAEESLEKVEKQKDDAAIDAKNLESEIKYSEKLQSEEQREENAAEAEKENTPREPGCAVGKSGRLNVAKDPTDVLTTVAQSVSIEKKHLTAYFEGRPETPTMKIPLVELSTPIETLVRTQKCFRIFHKRKAYILCAESTKMRDEWVADLYKAVFCINSGRAPSKKMGKATAKGEEIKLPAKSTKAQRYMNKLREQNEEAAKAAEMGESVLRPKKKEVEEIQIVGGLNSAAKLTVNGDSVEFPVGVGSEPAMNEGNIEF